MVRRIMQIAAILLFIASIASGVWGVKESHWLYITLFGVLSTFATFLFILTHPVASQDH